MVWQKEIDELNRRLEMASKMGGEVGVSRQHENGKLTVRERVYALADPGSFKELSALAGSAAYENNELVDFLPYPRVIGTSKINGLRVLLDGGDFTVRGGAGVAPKGFGSEGNEGIIPPPPGYLEGIRELTDRRRLLLIADETMCGMGRTGKLFAVEHWDVEPDIIVLGKALGAYCPLAATIFSEKVSRGFDDNLFGHGQSY